jgi:hypothetical protein
MTFSVNRRGLVAGCGAAVALAWSQGGVRAFADEAFLLLTDEEMELFKQKPLQDDDVDTRALSFAESAGPIIQVASPTGSTLKSPVNFDVRIKPKNGVPVAMSSLKVEYKLGPFWTDITGRLAGHGSVIGTRLKANGAKLPKGKHKVQLTVLDVDGRRTRAVAAFAVVG